MESMMDAIMTVAKLARQLRMAPHLSLNSFVRPVAVLTSVGFGALYVQCLTSYATPVRRQWR